MQLKVYTLRQFVSLVCNRPDLLSLPLAKTPELQYHVSLQFKTRQLTYFMSTLFEADSTVNFVVGENKLLGAFWGFRCSTSSFHQGWGKITALPYCLPSVQFLKYIHGQAAREGSATWLIVADFTGVSS